MSGWAIFMMDLKVIRGRRSRGLGFRVCLGFVGLFLFFFCLLMMFFLGWSVS